MVQLVTDASSHTKNEYDLAGCLGFKSWPHETPIPAITRCCGNTTINTYRQYASIPGVARTPVTCTHLRLHTASNANIAATKTSQKRTGAPRLDSHNSIIRMCRVQFLSSNMPFQVLRLNRLHSMCVKGPVLCWVPCNESCADFTAPEFIFFFFFFYSSTRVPKTICGVRSLPVLFRARLLL